MKYLQHLDIEKTESQGVFPFTSKKLSTVVRNANENKSQLSQEIVCNISDKQQPLNIRAVTITKEWLGLG